MSRLFTISGIKWSGSPGKYSSKLRVDGFPTSKEYEVKLYAIGENEQESAPLSITVHPLTPPYIEAFNTLEVFPDYSGARVELDNQTQANLMVGVIVKNASGEWEDVHKAFVSSKNVKFTFRGFEAEERQFGFFVRDQWQNYSDTSFREFTPWEEIKIDLNAATYKEITLPGDAGPSTSARTTRKLFDGIVGAAGAGFYSDDLQGTPQHITLYFQGGTYQLSRFKMWMNWAQDQWLYNSLQPKKIRIWGSMDPNPNGTFDSTWFVMKIFDNWKPSGLPPGQNTDEDIQVAKAGNEFVLDSDSPPVRYIRFETLENWTPSTHVYITELAFWGRKID